MKTDSTTTNEHSGMSNVSARRFNPQAVLTLILYTLGYLLLALAIIRLFLGATPFDVASPRMMLDRLFDLLITFAIVLLSFAIGRVFLCRIGWYADSLLEDGVFAFGVGSGLLSLFLLLLGLAGMLYAPVLIGVLVVGLVFTQSEWRKAWREVAGAWVRRVPLSRVEYLLILVLVAIALPSLIAALLPPTSGDALAYHLLAPAQYLKNHRVFAAFDNVGINYPMSTSMLFLFGLAAGTDIPSQLVHWSFTVILTVAVFAMTRRYLPRTVAFLASAIFWTSAMIGLMAGTPIFDLAWAFYEFLAVYAFFRWRDSHQRRDLMLAGVACGFALSDKYIAAVGFAVLGCLLLFGEMRRRPWNLRALVQDLALFAGVAALVAFPWYLKNWVWLGNPLYPFFFGNYGLDGTLRKPVGALSGLEGWIGLGMGHDLPALILFPWNVYANWMFFGPGVNRGGPSLFFIALPLYFFLPKRSLLNWLLLICTIRFFAWWPFYQNIRYLTIIFPWLCISSAYVVYSVGERLRRPSWHFGLGLCVALTLLFAIAVQWAFLIIFFDQPFSFLVGANTRNEFLAANLPGYPSAEFMNRQLPVYARILALGDHRVYYVERSIIIDDSHENWLDLMMLGGNAEGIAAQLQHLGVTHIWISEDDITYYLNYVDSDGRFKRALPTLNEFRARNLTLLYGDDGGHFVYALNGDAR